MGGSQALCLKRFAILYFCASLRLSRRRPRTQPGRSVRLREIGSAELPCLSYPAGLLQALIGCKMRTSFKRGSYSRVSGSALAAGPLKTVILRTRRPAPSGSGSNLRRDSGPNGEAGTELNGRIFQILLICAVVNSRFGVYTLEYCSQKSSTLIGPNHPPGPIFSSRCHDG